MVYKFKELKYDPSDYEKLSRAIKELEEKARRADSPSLLDEVLITYDRVMDNVGYNYTLAYIHASLDSSDEFWQKALEEEGRGASMLDTSILLTAIMENPFFPQLVEKYGKELENKIKRTIETEGKAQNERAELENLVSLYQRTKAMIRADYQGKKLSEGQLSPLFDSPDREERVNSRKAVYNAFLEKKEELGDLLVKMIALRDRIAKENGFPNYLEYMNACYSRSDYGEKELDSFVEGVKKYVAPVLEEITEENRKRLGLEKMTSIDFGLMFPSGNPKPRGGAEYLTEKSRKMYMGLSAEMGDFFSNMVESESIDVSSSPNKVSGMGFCTSLKRGMYPFVFGNLDGTDWDIVVYTHEVGHAWQGYYSEKFTPLNMLLDMPLDAVEIPSKTMELFSYPYSQEFFGEDGERFCFSHFRKAIKEIVSYSACHELNTWIYTHVGAGFDEINNRWLELQAQYYPYLSDGEVEEENRKGAGLLRNMGVYMFPRYLVSYALSEICAIDLFMLFLQDKEKALESYNILCSMGGRKSYPEILSAAGLTPSYKEGKIEDVMEKVKAYLLDH